MKNIWLLAQAQNAQQYQSGITAEPLGSEQTSSKTLAPGEQAPPESQPKKAPVNIQSFILLGLMFVVMYFLLFRGPRKKQQKHKQMVQELKKNDKVQTVGGIIGTIVDVKPDYITLKVDESNNTKIRISSAAIAKNVSTDIQ